MVVHAARAEHRIVRTHRGLAEPALPVEPGFQWFLRQIAPFAGSADADVNRFDCADATAPNELAREAKLTEHTRPLLAAGLKDALVFARRFDAKLRFADRQRERLLAIDVLACQAGLDNQDRCTSGRVAGNHNRVDVLALMISRKSLQTSMPFAPRPSFA